MSKSLAAGSLAGIAGCSGGGDTPGTATVATTATRHRTSRTSRTSSNETDGCPNVEYVLDTGYDQAAGTTLSPGDRDDDWEVVASSKGGQLPRMATVSDAIPASAFGDSAWISIDADGGQPLHPYTQYEYRYCFCLHDTFGAPELHFRAQADNEIAEIRLNGTSLPYSGNGSALTGDVITETYSDPADYLGDIDGVTYATSTGSGWSVTITSNGDFTAIHQNPSGVAPGDCLPTIELTVDVAAEVDFPGDGEVKNCADVYSMVREIVVDKECITHQITAD